jgi:hypothetical protein
VKREKRERGKGEGEICSMPQLLAGEGENGERKRDN